MPDTLETLGEAAEIGKRDRTIHCRQPGWSIGPNLFDRLAVVTSGRGNGLEDRLDCRMLVDDLRQGKKRQVAGEPCALPERRDHVVEPAWQPPPVATVAENNLGFVALVDA